MPATSAPVSLFGQGTLTLHIQALFRTPPGWDLFIGGSPNSAKDGIAPLSGVIETDWSPRNFTMNWRFTRRNHRIPIRGPGADWLHPVDPVRCVGAHAPQFVPLNDNPEAARQFAAWSQSRNCAASNTSRADVVPATCSVSSAPRSIHPAFTASNISSAGPVWPFGMPNCSNASAHPARGTAKAFMSRFRTSPTPADVLPLHRPLFP